MWGSCVTAPRFLRLTTAHLVLDDDIEADAVIENTGVVLLAVAHITGLRAPDALNCTIVRTVEDMTYAVRETPEAILAAIGADVVEVPADA